MWDSTPTIRMPTRIVGSVPPRHCSICERCPIFLGHLFVPWIWSIIRASVRWYRLLVRGWYREIYWSHWSHEPAWRIPWVYREIGSYLVWDWVSVHLRYADSIWWALWYADSLTRSVARDDIVLFLVYWPVLWRVFCRDRNSSGIREDWCDRTYYFMKKLNIAYSELISPENVLRAYVKFKKWKSKRSDVLTFDRHREKHLFALIYDLEQRTYSHGEYERFIVHDPKKRLIHKATVRDRIVHQMLYDILMPYYDMRFITHSYSSRKEKWAHRAIDMFDTMELRVSCNYTRPCYVLKCDIRQFFASIDQDILLTLLSRHIRDCDILDLLRIVVTSFAHDGVGIGIPLGNLTSQIFGNIYLDIFDQYIRHTLHIREYIRYADDFVIFSRDRVFLEQVLSDIALFVSTHLHLTLHPDKIEIRSIYAGVDFLGWHIFPHHRILRTKSKRRMINQLEQSYRADMEIFDSVIQSYFSLLSHGNTYRLEMEIRNQYGYIFD